MTYSELRTQFEFVENDWKNRLKDLNYKDLEYAWPHKSPLYRKGMAYMTVFLGVQVYEHLLFELDGIEIDWGHKLFYILEDEKKLKIIKERLDELSIFLKNHPNKLISPVYYIEDLLGARLPHFMFNEIPTASQERIMEATKNDLEELEIYSFVYKEMGEFVQLNSSIIEFLYLKAIAEEIVMKGKVNIIDTTNNDSEQKNEYPEIFKSDYSYFLFNHIIEDQKNKGVNMGPALLTKLFAYFKDEKLIYKVKPMPYLKFLKNKHGIKIKKLDKRAAPDTDDINKFNRIKKNFFFEKKD